MHKNHLTDELSNQQIWRSLLFFLQKQQKVEDTWLVQLAYPWKTSGLQSLHCTNGGFCQGESVSWEVPLLAFNLTFKSKINSIAVRPFGKDSKAPDVNQYIRSCAMYLFHIRSFLLPIVSSISWIHPGLCLEAIRQDVCLMQWCLGWIPSVFFTANWKGPWAVWLVWSFWPWFLRPQGVRKWEPLVLWIEHLNEYVLVEHGLSITVFIPFLSFPVLFANRKKHPKFSLEGSFRKGNSVSWFLKRKY